MWLEANCLFAVFDENICLIKATTDVAELKEFLGIEWGDLSCVIQFFCLVCHMLHPTHRIHKSHD